MFRSRQNLEQLGLLLGRHHPAGGIARGVDEQRPGPRTQGGADIGHVEMPSGVRLPLAHVLHFGAGGAERSVDVRPARAHDDRVIADAQHHLGGDGESEHGGPGDGDPIRVEVDPVEGVEVALQRVSQVLPAAGVGVERIAVVERLLRGVADEPFGDDIPLAEPQGDHVRIVDARQSDPGDSVLLESSDLGAKQCHGGTSGAAGRALYRLAPAGDKRLRPGLFFVTRCRQRVRTCLPCGRGRLHEARTDPRTTKCAPQSPAEPARCTRRRTRNEPRDLDRRGPNRRTPGRHADPLPGLVLRVRTGHDSQTARAKRSAESPISTKSATFLKVSGSVPAKPRWPARTPAIRIGAKTAVRQ